MTVQPQQTTSYSLDWAENVVNQLFHSHARAPYFFSKILHLDEKRLAKVLASRPVEWRFLKEFWHQYSIYVDKQTRVRPDAPVDDETLVKAALSCVKKVKTNVNSTEKLLAYIDEQLNLFED